MHFKEPVSHSKEGVPQFTTDQLNYFDPEDHGFLKFEVLESPPEMKPTFEQETYLQERCSRSVHRYCGIERFKLVLGQLIGSTFGVPYQVLSEEPWTSIFEGIRKLEPPLLWEGTREILKKNSMKIYFNRIPSIIAYAGWRNCCTAVPTGIFLKIMDDFKKLYNVFHRVKKELNRKYFLNMRYVAIRLLKRYGIETSLNIPELRSKTKRKELGILYDKLWLQLIDDENDDLMAFFDE